MTDTTRCGGCGRGPRGCVCLSPQMYEDASTIGLAMQQDRLDAKLSAASEYGGIPDVRASSWYDPDRDGPGRGTAGDGAAAMISLARDLQVPRNASEREAAGQAEALRLAAEYDGEFGLAGPLHPLAPTGPSAFAGESERYGRMMDELGIQPAGATGKARRHHGKPGSGRPVSSRTRAHYGELDQNGQTDDRQPHKGNVAHPGLNSNLEKVEQILGNHKDSGYFVRGATTRPGYRQPAAKSQTGYR